MTVHENINNQVMSKCHELEINGIGIMLPQGLSRYSIRTLRTVVVFVYHVLYNYSALWGGFHLRTLIMTKLVKKFSVFFFLEPGN